MERKTNMSFRTIILTAMLVVGGVALSASGLDVLDFESIPSGSLVDDMLIGDQYEAAYGMRFRLDLDADGLPDDPAVLPLLEQTGGPREDFGFITSSSGTDLVDQAAAGYESRLGGYFLRAPSLWPFNLVVLFSQPVEEVSADIWDLDGESVSYTEQWRIDAMGPAYLTGDANAIVDTLLTPEIADLEFDGKPYGFTLRRPERDIVALRLTFVGGKTYDVGVGFDNFATVVPEPATVSLLALGGMALIRRRNK